MINLKTVSLQLINGDADGIKICRVTGSTLLTVVIPRDLIGEAKTLPDIPMRGVYYLLDDNKGRLRRVYAGQTTQGVDRLDSHYSKKELVEQGGHVPGTRQRVLARCRERA